MAEVVHASAALDSVNNSNSTSFTSRLNLPAATLSGAGFQINDDVIVMVFALVSCANTATQFNWRITYNGVSLMPTPAIIDAPSIGANEAETTCWMTRTNLGGTIADFDFQNLRSGTSANISLQKCRIVVLRCADLGTEDVDWFWDESTSNQAHTTTYSGTSRATITWTPGSATEDWLIIASDVINIDSTSVNAEGRVLLDGATLVAGDYSEEGEATTEVTPHLFVGIMENLSTASHTIAYQSRDDTATAANDHLHSAILLIRAGKFPDLFWDTPADNSMANDTPEQIAAITASLSEAQDALILASMRLDIGAVDAAGWFWVEINTSPQAPDLDPTGAQLSTSVNVQASDATDENQATWLGILALSSGAQDLELMAEATAGSSPNAEEIVFVCWGLELGGAVDNSIPEKTHYYRQQRNRAA